MKLFHPGAGRIRNLGNEIPRRTTENSIVNKTESRTNHSIDGQTIPHFFGKTGFSMLSSFRSRLLALLILTAILAGAAGYRLGWWDKIFAGARLPPKGRDKVPDKPEPTALDRFMETFHAADAAQREKLEAELSAEFGEKWKDSIERLNDDLKSAKEGKPDVDPYLNLDRKKAGVLGSLTPPDGRADLKRMLALRRYLHMWRDHLLELRRTAQKAKLGELAVKEPQKLLDYPTIRLLAESASDQPAYVALEKRPSREKAPTPMLPWLTSEDREIAEAVYGLMKSEAATGFLKDRLGIEPVGVGPELSQIVSAFHKHADQLTKEYAAEVGQAIDNKLGPDRDALTPTREAVRDWADDLAREETPQLLAPKQPTRKP